MVIHVGTAERALKKLTDTPAYALLDTLEPIVKLVCLV